jgi:tRNA(Leu) C34 or U34 (ribose-2'-O)-methylase TrmL
LEWEAVDDWQVLVERLPQREPWLFTKTAQRLYTEPRYEPGDIMVFGSESQGLPPALLRKFADRTLRIPICSQVRNLDLSNSVAIAAFEAFRRRPRSATLNTELILERTAMAKRPGRAASAAVCANHSLGSPRPD